MNHSHESAQVLRAVLFTDIVESSRFFTSGGDKAGLDVIRRHNQYLFPIIKSANGQIIKTIGDSIMAVFEHPSNALRAAFTIQSRLTLARQSQTEDKELHVRIGVHYGLVSEVGNDVFGDVVNMTDRVKSYADKDKILVSRTMRDLLKADHRFKFQSVGMRDVKGSTEPMELFELINAPEVRETSLITRLSKRAAKTIKKHSILIPGTLVVILGAILLLQRILLHPEPLPPNTIAVLPFLNLNNDPKTDYLSIALAAELNAQLQIIDSTTVRPLSSVISYKGLTREPKEVAKRLQASILIDGNFVSTDNGLRVNVEIIDILGDRQLPVKPYQGKIEDTLDMLNQTAREVVNALQLQTLQNTDLFRYGTEYISAYDEYLRGISLLSSKITPENNRSAIDSLRSAVRLDTDFARAHAALSQACSTRYWWNFSDDRVWLEEAEQAARKSLELDPNLVEGHYALAYALEGKGKRSEAIRAYMTCFKLNSRYVPALIYLARYAFYMAEFDLALLILERIARLDPTQNIHIRRAINLYFAGRLKESRNANERAEMRAEGVDELTFIGFTYVWLQNIDAAERVLKELEKLEPNAPSISEVRAWIYTARGNFDMAQKEMNLFSVRKSWDIKQGLAALHALHGQKEKALQELEEAVALGGPSYVWFKSDHFKTLQNEPRYQQVLKKFEDEYAPLRVEFKQLFK